MVKDMCREIVVAGIVERDNKILICQRRYPPELTGKWEFPGGKVEIGETWEEALQRELFEELCIRVCVCEFFESVNFTVKNKPFTLAAYRASYTCGEIFLKDHQEYQWVKNSDLVKFDFAQADIPIVEKLLKNYWG